jgi:ketosteroid isomerase-like protein
MISPHVPLTAVQIQDLLVERWNSGDLDGIYELWDEHFVVRPDPNFPEQVCFGREAARQFWESQREIMGASQIVVEQKHDLGDRCLVRVYQPVHSRSGVESGYSWSWIITCRAGKAILAEFFIDHAQALEALGFDTDEAVATRRRAAEEL